MAPNFDHYKEISDIEEIAVRSMLKSTDLDEAEATDHFKTFVSEYYALLTSDFLTFEIQHLIHEWLPPEIWALALTVALKEIIRGDYL